MFNVPSEIIFKVDLTASVHNEPSRNSAINAGLMIKSTDVALIPRLKFNLF